LHKKTARKMLMKLTAAQQCRNMREKTHAEVM
jgi:hypothetical protein